MKRVIGVLFVAMFLPGCAAYNLGTYQTLDVSSTPDRAVCRFYNKQGAVFSTVATNGRIHNIRRGRVEIPVTCSKEGYADTTVMLVPETDIEASGLMFFTLGIDAVLGTNAKYPDSLHVVLARN